MSSFDNSNSGFSNFGSNKYVSGTKEFLESNSIVAKFAFLLLVLILFVFALRLGTSILTYIFSPSPNPILINGMIDAKQMMVIPQDPSTNGAVPIMRSQNARDGLVFTWSVWVYIDDLQYRQNEYRHVFHKGNDNINTTKAPIGMNQPFINTLFMKEMITYIFGHILIYNGFCTYTTLFIFTQHFDMLTLMKLDTIEKIMYTLCHCYVIVLLMYTNTNFICL